MIQNFRNNRKCLQNIAENIQIKYIDGGIHYSWLGCIDNIRQKFDSVVEYDIISKHNNSEHIKNCIMNVVELFDRTGHLGEI